MNKLLHGAIVGSGVKDVGEIHCEADLPSETRARDVFASEQAETEAEAVAEGVLAAGHGLKLRSSQISVVGVSAVKLGSEGERGAEVVQQREAAAEDMAAGVRGPQYAGAGVAGEEISEVCGEPGFGGEGLLRDQVEPVVFQARAELLGSVSSGELDVKTGGESRDARGGGLLVEAGLDAQIGVSNAAGRLVARGAIDREIGGIHIEFEIVRQAVVELEVGGILLEVGVLQLEGVVFVEELEVPLATLGDTGVIGIKGQLGVERPAGAEHTG